MTPKERKDIFVLLDYIECFLREHCDLDAREDDPSPDDAFAHTHGLMLQKIEKFRIVRDMSCSPEGQVIIKSLHRIYDTISARSDIERRNDKK